jgi:RNA-directed DNA polymerase
VYLNALDHFVKHDLGMRYYGRYVDDFVLAHPSHEYLKALIPQIADFLQSTLKLTLHPRKMYLQHYSKGVHFLGMIISQTTLRAANELGGIFTTPSCATIN